MSGRHAGRLSRLHVAWLGARELVIFAAVGLVVPVVLLVSVPQLLDGGTAMVDAPTCAPDGPTRGCLEPVAVAAGSSVDVELPGSTERPAGDVHVLRWEGEGVALLLEDGEIVEGLRWAQLYDVDVRMLWLAPVWPLALLLVCAALLRRHRRKLAVLSVVALGAAVAGPAAALGMQEYGYRGLVAGGIGTLGITLVLAGLAQLLLRRRSRYQARRVASTTVRMPAQREHLELDDESVHS